jgi:integrase
MKFQEQAEKFMAQISARKRNPVRTATMASYRSLLNKWILPALGGVPLADVQNGTVKPLVDALAKAGKSAQTIASVLYVIKAVVKSATDVNGNQLCPRNWNGDFMDVPTVCHADQKAPTPTPKAVQKAVDASKGRFKALVALLAGTGLRIGEALALRVGQDNGKDSYWLPRTGTLIVRSTVAKSVIQYAPKTAAGRREIDLHPDLNAFLVTALGVADFTDNQLLFADEDGGPLRSNSTALYNALHAASIPGFHALRRFRITHLDAKGASRGYIKSAAGHCDKDMTDRYTNSNVDVIARKAATEAYGLGFQLEAI